MSIYDIKSKEEWQLVLDDICEQLGMTAAISDTKKIIIQSSGERNALCSAIRENKESLVFICSQTQQFMAQEAERTRKPVIDACEAGMSKFVIPIFFKGEYQGTLTGCGICVHRKEIESFVIEKSSKMKEEEICRLAQDVNEIEQAKVDDMAKRLFQEIQSYA